MEGTSSYIDLDLYMPIFGIPLEGRLNPVVVCRLKNTVGLKVSLDVSDENRVSISGYRSRVFRDILRRFVEELSQELQARFSVEIDVYLEKPVLLPGALYVLATQYIGEIISEGQLSSEDLVKALIVIDRKALGRNEFIEALRWGLAKRSSIAFRRSDEIIEIDDGSFMAIDEMYRSYRIGGDLAVEGELMDLLTKTVGITSIYGVRYVRARDLENLSKLIFFHNRLWSMIYGLPIIKSYNEIYIYDGVVVGRFRYGFR